ncbi:hypothetical protein BpHYR1_026619 [Brachionus plicatilis]|uniref:Uncharacterized protein n=1 Tax=Brachionus plicatilis TaxID=10195 RepID=A0A3M7T8B6_BRAPC|nr:hypothetical protein BpHYR1_026619 [Brachionus plicatilis]
MVSVYMGHSSLYRNSLVPYKINSYILNFLLKRNYDYNCLLFHPPCNSIPRDIGNQLIPTLINFRQRKAVKACCFCAWQTFSFG